MCTNKRVKMESIPSVLRIGRAVIFPGNSVGGFVKDEPQSINQVKYPATMLLDKLTTRT